MESYVLTGSTDVEKMIALSPTLVFVRNLLNSKNIYMHIYKHIYIYYFCGSSTILIVELR